MNTFFIVVKFNQSSYIIHEVNLSVQITVVLSNPSTNDITIQVLSIDESATSKLSNTYIVNSNFLT